VISPEWLFQCRERIFHPLENFGGKSNAPRYLAALDVFFPEYPAFTPEDILKRGIYRVLLLGTRDVSLLRETIGFLPDGLLEPTNSFPVSLERTTRGDSIEFYFRRSPEPPPPARTMMIEQLFDAEGVEAAPFLESRPFNLPPLVIQSRDRCHAILRNPVESFRDLYSSGLLREVNVRLRVPRVESCNQAEHLFNRIDLIPENALTDSSGFEKFQTDRLHNFVILNSADDYLIKTFVKLTAQYRKALLIPERNSLDLLSLVLFSSDPKQISESRLLTEEQGQNLKSLESLGKSLDIRLSLGGTLRFLTHMFRCALVDLDRHARLRDTIEDAKGPLDAAINEKLPAVLHDVSALYPQLKSLGQAAETARAKLEGKLKNREEVIQEFRNLLLNTVECARRYGTAHLDRLTEMIKHFDEEVPEFTKESFLLHRYIKNKEEVKARLSNVLMTVEECSSKMEQEAKVEELSKMNAKMQASAETLALLRDSFDGAEQLLDFIKALTLEITHLVFSSTDATIASSLTNADKA
jgi:hypothetical protein